MKEEKKEEEGGGNSRNYARGCAGKHHTCAFGGIYAAELAMELADLAY